MATDRRQPQRAPRRSAAAARAARGLGRSKMFGPLMYDGMMRLARRERASRTSDFLVRNSVPAECPIVWANSVDRLVQIGTAGTSWYESGTEVTDRREPRENR